MAVCSKCGIQVEDSVKFCPVCGQEIEASFIGKVKGLNDTEDQTGEFETQDIEENKWISLLSYLGPLVFIPMFVKKNSRFARYHANQGLVLFITEGVYSIITGIIMAVLRTAFPVRFTGYTWTRGFVYNSINTVFSLASLVFVLLAVLGIINVVKGKAKDLPVIGKIRLIR